MDRQQDRDKNVHNGLVRLNSDVLFIIAEILRPERGLRPLSLTCWDIRRVSIPVLFRRAVVQSERLVRSDLDAFIPATLRPFIQSLTFVGAFPKPPRHSRPWTQVLRFPLKDALSEMTILRHVTITETMEAGIPLVVFMLTLGLPSLTDISVTGPIERGEVMPEEIQFPVSPLLSFRYQNLAPWRIPGRQYSPAAALVLRNVVDQARGTLKAFVAPAESIPVDLLPKQFWPCLEELSLVGERDTIERANAPLVYLLGTMSRLRTLHLSLTLTHKAKPQPVWPSQDDGRKMPWPRLEELMVTYPHPSDTLYRHLPPCLTRLSLRCWPRHYVHDTWLCNRMGWTSPIASSSDILAILRECTATGVTDLDVEFWADTDDLDLFHEIPCRFSHITHLTIHRYRALNTRNVPVNGIAAALAPLLHLRILRLHLDFIESPNTSTFADREERDHQIDVFFARLDSAAEVFAQVLSPSLLFVCFLNRQSESKNMWAPYHVRDAGDGTRRATFDVSAAAAHGVWIQDTLGPSYMDRYLTRGTRP
ncbi:hypothetical protein C8Q79DRAFT_978442 [Trametes meyenii]|nr:hypothetical protein C8Q79DRAFT_978442 [Trametes meyenii]